MCSSISFSQHTLNHALTESNEAVRGLPKDALLDLHGWYGKCHDHGSTFLCLLDQMSVTVDNSNEKRSVEQTFHNLHYCCGGYRENKSHPLDKIVADLEQMANCNYFLLALWMINVNRKFWIPVRSMLSTLESRVYSRVAYIHSWVLGLGY